MASTRQAKEFFDGMMENEKPIWWSEMDKSGTFFFHMNTWNFLVHSTCITTVLNEGSRIVSSNTLFLQLTTKALMFLLDPYIMVM